MGAWRQVRVSVSNQPASWHSNEADLLCVLNNSIARNKRSTCPHYWLHALLCALQPPNTPLDRCRYYFAARSLAVESSIGFGMPNVRIPCLCPVTGSDVRGIEEHSCYEHSRGDRISRRGHCGPGSGEA